MTDLGGDGLHVPPAAPRRSASQKRVVVDEPKAPEADGVEPRRRKRIDDIALAWRIADGYLAIGAFLLLEIIVVAIVHRRELVGIYEPGLAITALWPITFAAAAPIAVAAGVIVELARHAQSMLARLGLSLASAAYGAWVAFGVSTGRHLAGGARVPFVLGVALVGFFAAFAVGPLLARALVPRRDKRFVLHVVLAVVVIEIVLELVNALVLPRLYPAFHRGLALLSLLVVPFVTVAFDGLRELTAAEARPARGVVGRYFGKLARVAMALVAFALCCAVASLSAQRMAPADNMRLVYATHAPIVSNGVEIAALLSPPPPLDDAPFIDAQRQAGRSLDLSGRDIVLITVDALRADHLSSYGYPKKITPNIDALAEGGVVFEHAYTPTPHTSYAVTSLMTGKYIRPLVLQGLGADSETWAGQLRRYGYKTAAFYPPAVFFIDAERFGAMRDRGLDFEYRKVEFASASLRANQVRDYLDAAKADSRLFMWVHLFEPHEPYEAHADHSYGDRDIDRYDAEIAVADAGIGEIVADIRKRRPNALVIISADHGEEFQEHGGRYHGTSVYEEQVRVPLVLHAPGLFSPRRVPSPVTIVDLFPTVLAGLDIPRPARVRGTDIGPFIMGTNSPESARGFAFAETDTMTMLARGPLRLVCARRIGACALYDVKQDPGQTRDLSAVRIGDMAEMRAELRAVEGSHGRYEIAGLRIEGKGWPDALRRGIAGDADAAEDVAALLDDADVAIRRKAAEVLFELRQSEVAATMRLALLRDEDDEVRRWCALGLTRLGEGASLTRELVTDADPAWRHMAALALAESGDGRGETELVAWLREGYGKNVADKDRLPFERAKEIVVALGKIKAKSAVTALIDTLDDVRLAPHAAAALAAIGQESARPALAEHLATERYQHARVALAEALVALGGGPELVAPLVRLLGVPDPLPNGLRLAIEADIVKLVGGPRDRDLARLRQFARSGVPIRIVVPKRGTGDEIRAICRARSMDDRPGEIRFGMGNGRVRPSTGRDRELVPIRAPELDPKKTAILHVPPGEAFHEVFTTLPESVGVRPGDFGEFVVYATQNIEITVCVVVPLSPELPPPPPEPWTPETYDGTSPAPSGSDLPPGVPNEGLPSP
ncbi:MAG: sulfatase-like hydrolase/transferase [Polyangiaceae bacterium]|nr:sulfatase-like hydrolase/transferase [Polyangiaceae bacterium]